MIEPASNNKLLCLHAGMPTLVFLTKIDQCHSELATDVPRLNGSERLRTLIQVRVKSELHCIGHTLISLLPSRGVFARAQVQ